MGEVHIRGTVPNYYKDEEMLMWHRDKRATYAGMYDIADESGVLDDDPSEVKALIWSSPLDDDITVEMIGQWIEEFVQDGKMMRFRVDDGSYLRIKDFQPAAESSGTEIVPFEVRNEVATVPLQVRRKLSAQESLTGFPMPADEVLSGRGTGLLVSVPRSKESAYDDPDFLKFWAAYPRHEAKKDAAIAFRNLSKHNRSLCIAIAQIMGTLVQHGVREKKYVPYPATYIRGERWMDWEDGVPADWINGRLEREQSLWFDIATAIDEVWGHSQDADDESEVLIGQVLS